MQESEREIRQTQKWGRRKEDVAVGVDRGVEEILTDCRYEDCSKLIYICYIYNTRFKIWEKCPNTP